MKTVWLLLFSALVTGLHAQEASVPSSKEDFHLFLLVGQSNMAGRGKVSDEDKKPHPRVLVFTEEGEWAPAADPLHFDKPVAGVGPGKAFGIRYAEAEPEVTVGLIPCAVGGSPIRSWTEGAFYKATKSHPWDDAIVRAKAAMQSGTLKGILWHQGESDSKKTLADAYEAKLHDLIARFRKVLDAPEVPFLAGQMGKFEERPWDEHKKKVDAAHQSLPEKVEGTAFVGADGLEHKGDEVHFSAEAARELGRRFADVYFDMTAERE